MFAKNARLQNRLPEMLGELAGLCWDIVLFSETLSALGTVRFGFRTLVPRQYSLVTSCRSWNFTS